MIINFSRDLKRFMGHELNRYSYFTVSHRKYFPSIYRIMLLKIRNEPIILMLLIDPNFGIILLIFLK